MAVNSIPITRRAVNRFELVTSPAPYSSVTQGPRQVGADGMDLDEVKLISQDGRSVIPASLWQGGSSTRQAGVNDQAPSDI